MGHKYGYRFSQLAETDLDEIVSYISIDLSNPGAASDFINKLQKAIDEVRSFPDSGSPVINEFLAVEDMRKVLVGNYIMFYLPEHDENVIYVVRILYTHRNIDEILRQLDL